MIRASILRWLGPVALAALAPLGAAACSQSDKDRAEQQVENAGSEAREAGREIGSSLENLGDDARRAVEQAADQARSSSRDVREAAVRNGVAAAAPGEFQRQGVELDGLPSCTATSPETGTFHVECTGTTKDGKPVKLVGDDPPEGGSTYVGTVDGREVFRQGCVGLC